MRRQLSAWLAVAALGSFVSVATAEAGTISFTDRAAFLAALGPSAVTDDLESYSLGAIASGSSLGPFIYTFGPAVAPAVASDGLGGQALGGPFDVFVGGDVLTLATTGATPLRAFGVDFAYAPSFEPVPADIYCIVIDDGADAGTLVGNNAGLDPAGGVFFLGFIAEPSSEFRAIDLLSTVPLDGDGNPYLVPAYQIDNLTYARGASADAVPEPATLTLGLLAGALAAARHRTLFLKTTQRTSNEEAA